MKRERFLRNVADELDSPAYGKNFYKTLQQFLSIGKLDERTAFAIIETLVDADEIRDSFSQEIQALLFQRIQLGKPVQDVLQFLQYCCDIYTTEEQNSYLSMLFSKMQEYVDIEEAFSKIKQDFSETTYRMSNYTILAEDNSNGVLYNTLYQTGVLVDGKQIEDIKQLIAKRCISKTHPLSAQLLERHFILEDGFDEKSYAELVRLSTIAKKSKELTLTIKTTMSCNLKCAYCWQTAEKGILSEEVAQRIVRMIAQKARESNRLVISWFGGEPMLGYKRILQIMDAVGEISGGRKLPYVGLMSTNGTLLNAQKAEELLRRHVYTYQITLDGMKQRHDASRPFVDSSKSSFDTIVANLKDIRDHVRSGLLEIIVRVNMTPDFLKEKEAFLDFYLREFGNDKRFKLVMQQVTDRGGERIEEYKQKKCLLRGEEAKEAIVKDLVRGHNEILYPSIHFQHGSLTCEVQNLNSYNINPDGTLYFCDLLSDHCNDAMNLMGSIAQDGTIVYKNAGVTDWKIPKHLNQCRECVIYPLCFGGLCPLNSRQTKHCNYVKSLDSIYNALLNRKYSGEITETIHGGAE